MILVTGGTGLVGSHLLYHLLQENDSVRAIHQKSSDLNAVKRVFHYYTSDFDDLFKRIRWVEASLDNIPSLETAFEDISHVYHCAAMVSFDSRDYQKMRRINIEGTTNVANLCISKKVQKLCFVSSVAAIENSNGKGLTDEIDNWSSATDKSGYAITKYGAEMEVWRASQEGVPVVIVNPGVIIGSGFWQKGTGRMFSNVKKGLKFYTEGVTGFVGVQDVVKAMSHLMNSNIQEERYILVSENLSFKEILFLMAKFLGVQPPKFKINRFLMGVLWRIEIFRSRITYSTPLITKRSAKSAMSVNPYTSRKIINDLNFQFEPLESCIKKVSKDFYQDLKG
ncbi:SDR family oxidoreductase [Lutimonas zeaxanthinifaciens]|uniref:SDR family oxidoreductase n=1 Tax=Lutimonas zeaxanthinifaciens TaxID=3060215 RepID=UPI00265CCBEC|nr:SDR family oxidoreductase [Lutimonas sp. YSD2104]WKK66011.1 SDR family oxidoreductase [Lutimonas sp. YSD2104]